MFWKLTMKVFSTKPVFRSLMARVEWYHCGPSNEVKTVVGLGLILIQCFIPLMVLIICCSKIIWVLTRRINTDLIENKYGNDNSKNIGNPEGKTETKVKDLGRDTFHLAKRNTIKTVLIIGLCFIICWSQNEVIYLMYNCGCDLNFNRTYLEFTILMVFFNCTVNPFIYLIKYRDYQEVLKKCFFL